MTLKGLDFAIYTCSTQSYSTQGMFSSRGRVPDLVGMAINAYSLR